MQQRVIRCTLSGSFHKDPSGLQSSYHELVTNGCQVLSPHRIDFDRTDILFVRDVAELNTPEATIENHHLLSIEQSDFLWVHAPDGYIGTSTALEIGFAVAKNRPIYSDTIPNEQVLGAFVQTVPSVYRAIERVIG